MSNNFVEQHAALMKRWSEKMLHKDNDFIQDGIIDLSRWQNADRKILEDGNGVGPWQVSDILPNSVKITP